MRKPIIVANWKMYKTVEEGKKFDKEFPLDKELFSEVEVVICPTFTALQTIGEVIRNKDIKLGAQNLYPVDEGAFTGEISPVMLKELGCSYVILGHSERRHILNETDSFINKKVKCAFKHELLPILCIGETLEERQKGKTEEVCIHQIIDGLEGVGNKDLAHMVVAYEPVWAIGSGINASADEAEETIALIRDVIGDNFAKEVAENMRIQYGGSVKPGNIKEFMKKENIDGALVGGASLKADFFYEIIKGARGGKEEE